MTASSKPTPKPAASKTNAYSRFIPREEIDEVASWSFSSMDSNLAPLELASATSPAPPKAKTCRRFANRPGPRAMPVAASRASKTPAPP